MDQERSEEIVILRYLSDSTWLMGVPSMQTDNLGGEHLWEMIMIEFGLGRIRFQATVRKPVCNHVNVRLEGDGTIM